MLTALLLIIFGIAALWKGANWLIHGSSALAKWLGISSLVIGLTIVAFGTSTPELVVNIFAAIHGNTDIAIGNIVGSNIANILLILGVAALILPLTVASSTIWKEIPFSLLAALVLWAMASDQFLADGSENIIGRGNGLVLLGFFIIYLYYTFGLAATTQTAKEKLTEVRVDLVRHFGKHTLPRMIGYIVLGLAALFVGGQALVIGAVDIAHALGVSETIIGLTIVAVGTSLPELVASAVAALRKEPNIAIGNVVGSNIFNIFWILGLTAALRPLPLAPILHSDLLFLVIITVVLFSSILFLGKRFVLTRGNGVLFVCLYVAYLVFLVVREIGISNFVNL